MTEDLFDKPVKRCPECGGTEGHFIGCSVMEVENEKRRGLCPVCFMVRPCDRHDDVSGR